jgi:acyl carrier protein
MSHFEKIKELIVDRFPVEAERVNPAAALRADLDLDSLDDCELEMAIEDAFDVEVPDGTSDNWKTVGDIEAFVKAAITDREMQGQEG